MRRRRLAVAVGLLTFAASLTAFTYLGLQGESGQVAVLSAARNIAAGQLISANTTDLSASGAMIHLGPAAARDTIPQSDYRQVQGAVALVPIPAGSLILRSELAMGAGSSLRQLTLQLAFLPPELSTGALVDLFSVSGTSGSAVAASADLCGAGAAGCVVPLAQSVRVAAVDQPEHSIVIDVAPDRVAPWLLLDATQSIWAVPAGALSCPGSEQAVSDPAAALEAIRQGRAVSCGP